MCGPVPVLEHQDDLDIGYSLGEKMDLLPRTWDTYVVWSGVS
jgi:hypothetical protein